jgi:hypothetical protein
MIRGWFVGSFSPTVCETKEFEAAVQYYRAGDSEPRNLHKIATEITIVVVGEAIMKDIVLKEGDIIVIKPGEATAFFAIKDTITTVIKFPSVPGDKYILETESK